MRVTTVVRKAIKSNIYSAQIVNWPHPCFCFQNGLSPLHMAAQSDHADAAKLLLKKGSPPDDVTMVSQKRFPENEGELETFGKYLLRISLLIL